MISDSCLSPSDAYAPTMYLSYFHWELFKNYTLKNFKPIYNQEEELNKGPRTHCPASLMMKSWPLLLHLCLHSSTLIHPPILFSSNSQLLNHFICKNINNYL